MCQVGLRRLLEVAVEENVEIPQLHFALQKGNLHLTPDMVLQEILQGSVRLPLFMFMKTLAKSVFNARPL